MRLGLITWVVVRNFYDVIDTGAFFISLRAMNHSPFTKKLRHGGLLLPGLLCGLVVSSEAATVIIDQTTRNGSFENVTSEVSPSSTLSDWEAPSGYTLERHSDGYAHNGNWSTVVGTGKKKLIYGAVISTGYTIALGETYGLSFQVRGAAGADNGDEIAYSLFYTDNNTLSGTPTVLMEGSHKLTGATSVLATSSWSFSGELVSTAADAVAAGKSLMLSFTPGKKLTADEFVRVDSVTLIAAPSLVAVPEPSTLTILGGSCLYYLLRRRRVSV